MTTETIELSALTARATEPMEAAKTAALSAVFAAYDAAGGWNEWVRLSEVTHGPALEALAKAIDSYEAVVVAWHGIDSLDTEALRRDAAVERVTGDL